MLFVIFLLVISGKRKYFDVLRILIEYNPISSWYWYCKNILWISTLNLFLDARYFTVWDRKSIKKAKEKFVSNTKRNKIHLRRTSIISIRQKLSDIIMFNQNLFKKMSTLLYLNKQDFRIIYSFIHQRNIKWQGLDIVSHSPWNNKLMH